MQLVNNATAGTRRRPAFAPAEARAIVGADTRCLTNGGLNETPIERGATKATFSYDCGAAGADALDVEAMAADVDQQAGRGKGALILGGGDGLVREAGGGEHEDQGNESA